ncbi:MULTISPECIES: hypothetical protein [unclassified Leisingera]|uniref:hypothetical protein n=1 Tax=unclassified Leisingera TaxID=2614906 RepID=UPI001269CA9C|nr:MULTISPECIES: hypothetical protein [unclassified Leisingera]
MKKLLIAAALVFGFSAPAAIADNGLKVGQNPYLLAIAKCTNSGDGNGAEAVRRTRDGFRCLKGPNASEDHPRDQDPGNSGNVPD